MKIFKYLRTLLLCLGVTLVCLAQLKAIESADFYISTEGSDQWSGTLDLPNADRSDGPFATLSRARDAVRELKQSRPAKDIVVQIRGGLYPLSETVIFGVEDSGEGAATITYEAYPEELPVFSSGKKIESWKKVSGPLPGLPEIAQDEVWVTDISEQFFTLYDEQGLLPRARSDGFIPLEGGSTDRVHYPEGTLKNWSNLEDVELVIRPHHAWVVNILPLKSVNEQKQMAHTSIIASYAMSPLHYLPNLESCWVENVLEALDQPGEWVLNTQEQKLYLWPRSQSSVLFPQLIELIRVEGDIDEEGAQDIPVRNLVFKGLTFSHGERYSMNKGDTGLQHDWDFQDKATAMLRFRGAENCAVENSRFMHTGGGAIRFDLHAQNNRVVGNLIEHIGGTGVLLCGYGPGTKDVNRNNLVYNNHINHTGQIYSHSPGILVWQSGENRVANNLIHHQPYAGIIISGVITDFFHRWKREMSPSIRWHEVEGERGKRSIDEVRPYLHTHDNQIEYNEIHHVMQELNDGNAIYIRGAGPNNVIRGNYIHHMLSSTVMQAAIRTDGGQRDTLITENLIYKCVSQGMQVKLNNRAINNFIIDILPGTHDGKKRQVYIKLYEGPMTGGAYERNVFYHSGDKTKFYHEGKSHRTEVGAYAKDADTDYNIYYCVGDPAVSQAVLDKKQQEGVDAHSLAVDPLFVDLENGDFGLLPESPALTLGIKPFDLSKVGLIK
ncbi:MULTISPECIES: right-handed parallel beta-helix repeat-containing protein [unclassified Lentimonas]|uniref:right-handed parallel beta-helix repeat-containing protein n=1 Tax=unclassified Lentimonas TaxID=2630993 RepID=UPI0013256B1B|nr:MULTISPECIES: right-handed parallel beta-helix repeat-containing protein [unclassified Lentimonas]CAA6677957.1 Unannotated [Lentimonas sp. CC4]CAA6686070.1 Unannotated [Lentimonas sp. CC6]CAA6691553.1 Unannotated [Lentimonas sp. CC19]CAA6692206.1 Unannotated [Lentimonas sp. CC10]CAA7070152.1 Unannotated [Lentimonas sp. CC11]